MLNYMVARGSSPGPLFTPGRWSISHQVRLCGYSVQLRQAQLFFQVKTSACMVFATILITNCYIFGSNKGIICVLCTLKINYKHFVSLEMAPPIVNKAVINAVRLQLFSKMRKVNTR